MKTKDDIKNALSSVYDELTAYTNSVDDVTYKKSENGKWSIAQNIDHLTLSNNITALSLNMPKPVLKQLYKTNNRTNWNYDEVVWKYQSKLNNGAKASMPFTPKLSLVPMRGMLERLWKISCNTLLDSIDKWTEEDLDTYIIPHPIIGKITIRELLFFTVYHVGHHVNTIKKIK